MAVHTYKEFDVELEAIRTGVLTMGGQVEQQLTRAIGLLTSENGAELIDRVGATETAINEAQVALDQQCSQIIAKRQPTAIDLRTVLNVTKIVNELERAGDEVKKIAYRSSATRASNRLTQVRYHDVARAASEAQKMLQMALDAFARLDASAAAAVVELDDEIDAMFHSIMRQLISYMMEDPRTITPALEIVFIAKSIERVGDHAKNIAESVVQVVRGKDVRHATPEQIRAELEDE